MLKKVRKFLHHRCMALDILAHMRQDKGCCKAVEMDLKRCNYLTSACIWRAFYSQ